MFSEKRILNFRESEDLPYEPRPEVFGYTVYDGIQETHHANSEQAFSEARNRIEQLKLEFSSCFENQDDMDTEILYDILPAVAVIKSDTQRAVYDVVFGSEDESQLKSYLSANYAKAKKGNLKISDINVYMNPLHQLFRTKYIVHMLSFLVSSLKKKNIPGLSLIESNLELNRITFCTYTANRVKFYSISYDRVCSFQYVLLDSQGFEIGSFSDIDELEELLKNTA